MRTFLVSVDGTRNYTVTSSSTITAKLAARSAAINAQQICAEDAVTIEIVAEWYNGEWIEIPNVVV